MKFNQIPSASLHNSDCWSCTAAAGWRTIPALRSSCQSVSPSLPPLMMVEDRAATSIRHCPAWIPSQHVTLTYYKSFTSTSHQLECSRPPFIKLKHTIFIKFQTFGKILNIISSWWIVWEFKVWHGIVFLCQLCVPVQLKGCPVLVKCTMK